MKFLLRDNKDRSVLKRKHRPSQLYDDHLNRISISQVSFNVPINT